MRIATVGVHVLDTHLFGVESVPAGSEGQLIDSSWISAAGTAGGTALVLARLGAEVTTYGAIGADPAGDLLLGLLEREGVATRLVRKDDHQTSTSVIPVRPNGDRPAWHCIGANGAFGLADLPEEAFDGVAHVHLGGPEFLGGDAAAEVLRRARAAGATTSVDVLAPGDPGLLAWIEAALPVTDFLLPNDEQVLGFTGAATVEEGAAALLSRGAGCVAVTAGSRGAYVVSAGAPEAGTWVPAHEIEVVDTTGCGDAFSAGFVVGLLGRLGAGVVDAARLGCATAAHVAQGRGTDGGTYDLDTVRGLAGL
ncbi:MAG: PfkB family carbohydrate kinase [Nocardioides sp.]|uniref:carbohydrate kinase family protein n=1 Tax=Nocardioides sp. TaxID=35761 RepID=UPI0039E40119